MSWHPYFSKDRIDFFDELARIRTEAGDLQGAEKARQTARSMRP